MNTKAMCAALGVLLLAGGLTSCGGSDAEESCRDALEARFGEDGVVDIDNVEERSSRERTKVEGDLAYREDQGAGDRVDTWFVCQLDGDGEVVDLTVKE